MLNVTVSFIHSCILHPDLLTYMRVLRLASSSKILPPYRTFAAWRPQNIGTRRSLWHRLQNGGGNEYVVPGIIAINGGIFGLWYLGRNNRSIRRFMMDNFTMVPRNVMDNPLRYGHTIITSMFSHSDPWHCFANMFTLYFFGSSSVAFLGAYRFLGLYACSGLASSISSIVWANLSRRTRGSGYGYGRKNSNTYFSPVLGASGAINGIVLHNVATHPKAMVMIYGIIPMPAAVFGLLYVLKDVYELQTGTGGNTANIAHLGGAAMGLAYFLISKGRGRF